MKIFHHNDADGRLSAYLLWETFKKSYNLTRDDVIELDHVKDIPTEKVTNNEIVFFVDYSFSGYDIEKFTSLYYSKTKNIIWIDHHKSSINLQKDYPWMMGIYGIRRDNIRCPRTGIKFSGAALVKKFLVDNDIKPGDKLAIHTLYINEAYTNFEFGGEGWEEPEKDIVAYVSDYDTFSHAMDKTITMYYGWLYEDQDPCAIFNVWNEDLSVIMKRGNVIQDIAMQEYDSYLNNYGYITEIEGYSTIAVNRRANSMIFGDLYKENLFDIYMTYTMAEGNVFQISFFSNTVDVSQIAKKYNGGGHAGAAGCKLRIEAFNFPYIKTLKEWKRENM